MHIFAILSRYLLCKLRECIVCCLKVRKYRAMVYLTADLHFTLGHLSAGVFINIQQLYTNFSLLDVYRRYITFFNVEKRKCGYIQGLQNTVVAYIFLEGYGA